MAINIIAQDPGIQPELSDDLAGTDGILIATRDSGDNWMQHVTSLVYPLTDLVFC
jgi:hypothetical protein